MLKTNKFTITGILKNVVVKNGVSKDNKDYVSVKGEIYSDLDGKTNVFPVSFFANKLTKDNKDNNFFKTYSDLPNLEGKKVTVNGDLREWRGVPSGGDQLVSANQLNCKFISGANNEQPDEASFTVGGFIVNTVTEKTNKDKEVYRYDISIGQSNYNDSALNVFTLHIRPEDKDILEGVKALNAADTIELSGDIRFITTQVEYTDKNVGFGTPKTHIRTNTTKSYFITQGSTVYGKDDDGFYDSTIVRELISAYKAKDVELMAAAKDNKSSAASTTKTEAAPAVTQRQTSLL